MLSAATPTIIPRSGASPVYTTASGSSLVQGITYRVNEQQVGARYISEFASVSHFRLKIQILVYLI